MAAVPEVQEELECLLAIFPETQQHGELFQLGQLVFALPPGYPAEAAPRVWLAEGGHQLGLCEGELQAKMAALHGRQRPAPILLELLNWVGERCPAVLAAPAEDADVEESDEEAKCSAAASTAEARAREREEEEDGEEPLVVSHGEARRLHRALRAAGFAAISELCLVQAAAGLTIELKPLSGAPDGDAAGHKQHAQQRSFTLVVTGDDVDADDMSAFVRFELPGRREGQTAIDIEEEGDAYEGFVQRLLEWTAAQQNAAAPGFAADGGEDGEAAYAANDVGVIPGHHAYVLELEHDRERPLLILTWGCKRAKRDVVRQAGSQHNFNAAILNGRGGGVDLKRNNGLCEDVQRNVARCARFPDWLAMVVRTIERKNLSIISINCTHGRHRSVSAAEILAAYFYPCAQVRHLTIS